jgi:NAD(P)H-hydrate epimerase
VDGIVLGPGLGQSAWAYAVWRHLLRSEVPLVLDADGLNLLAAEPMTRERWLITPHPGEAARLLSAASAESVQRDRLGAARALAERYRATTVLKGPNTLVATPGGAEPIAVCDRGNPGMATGGTGDVLAGAIGALLAQGLEPFAAARLGVYLHGAAGEAARERFGDAGVLASDLPDGLAFARRRLAALAERRRGGKRLGFGARDTAAGRTVGMPAEGPAGG